MSDKNEVLTYKGRPLMRKDNLIYYGSMADAYIVMLQILESKKVGDMDVASRVLVQLQLTDPSVKSRSRVVKKSEKDGIYTVTLEKDPNADLQKAPAYEDTSWAVFCTENRIGSAENELGHNLIQMYFYTLTQMDTPPSVVAFMNEGVELVCQPGQIVDSLKALMEKGTRVVVCGTCLNYYDLSDKALCGTVSNMYEILEAVTACGKMMKI